MKKEKNTVKKKRDEGGPGLLPTALRCGAVGLLVTLLLLLAVAAGVVAGAVSQEMLDDFVLFCVIAGSAVGGVSCAKRWPGGVLTAGIAASAVYFLIVLAGWAFTAGGAGEDSILLKVAIASLAGGMFGGTLRLYKKNKKSKLRKKI